MKNRRAYIFTMLLFIAAAMTMLACAQEAELAPVETPTNVLTPTQAPEMFIAQEVSVPDMTPEPLPTFTPVPTPTPTPRGVLDASYDEYFDLTGISEEDTSYRDDMISVTYTKVTDEERQRTGKTLTYFVADIYVQDPTSVRRGMQYADSFARSNPQKIESLSKQYGAVCAISGDYVTAKDKALVIWNGEVVFDSGKYDYDTLVLYRDGRMECLSPKDKVLKADKLLEDGAWQTWCFGPTLLDGAGKPLTKFNLPDRIEPRNPRAVLGYYCPGHYCMVLIEGRQNGYSAGLSIEETAQLMSELGCVQAYNLDGGISAQFTFQGKRVTHPLSNRTIRDIVYVAPVPAIEAEEEIAETGVKETETSVADETGTVPDAPAAQ